MNAKNTITALILGSALVAGQAVASPDSESDVLYGGASVSSSPASVYVATGQRHEIQDYTLFNLDQVRPDNEIAPFERISDDRELSTDLIYGS